jgi:phosphoserine phosphatase
MAHVVCLIADPERTPLDRATIAALQRAPGGTARWLAEDEACELPVDFVAALRAGVALLEGLPVEIFEQVFRERIWLMQGARTLVRAMRAWGARAALVSGGFVPFVGRVGAAIGFDISQANRLETLNGRLTGRLLGPIRRSRSKLALLRQLTRVLRLQAAETLAVGDGANDLPMLRDAGLGVAFRPTPAVAPIVIRRGDLTALLYLQGVAKSDFVAG